MILKLNDGLYIKPVDSKGNMEIMIVEESITSYQTNVKQEMMMLYDLDIQKLNSIIFDFYNLVLDLASCSNFKESTAIIPSLKGQWQKAYTKLQAWNPVVATLIAGTINKSMYEDVSNIMNSTNGSETISNLKQYAINILACFTDISYVQYDIIGFLNDYHQGKIEFDTLTLDTSIYLDENKKSVVQYSIPDIYKFTQYICMRFIKSDAPLCKCNHCGRYFIPKKRGAAKYCNRINADGKTCKVLGAHAQHKENVSNDKVLKHFERTRDKIYKRFDRLEISVDEYDAWFSKAIKAKRDYQDDLITADEAMKIIFHE